MDKNRLIQIANHFDKIGAYTVSDEFENKFIRTAAPVDRKKRDPRVQAIVNKAGNASVVFSNLVKEANAFFEKQFPSTSTIIRQKQQSYNFSTTWLAIFLDLQNNNSYKTDPKKIALLKKIVASLYRAITEFEKVKPAAVTPAVPNDAIYNTYATDLANDNIQILAAFAVFVDEEDKKYNGFEEFDTYVSELRNAEIDMASLRNISINLKPLDKYPPTKPSQGGGGGTTTPSGGGNTTPSGGGTRPSARPNSGPKPPVAPSGKPSSKTTNLSVNEELSKIVFRKVRASNRKLKDDNIFLDMRIDNKYKTYLDVSKDKSLDGSIRAAIKASSFSDDFKQKLIKRLDAKIAKAIELNKAVDPVKPEPVKPEPVKPEPTPGPVDPNKPDPVNPAKPDADGFRCTREGLFTEIGRMDTMHNNDPDKYIRSYFGDIKRVIDCHESLRNSLSLKDNTQLDSLINILEAKYFSIIAKTQFPY